MKKLAILFAALFLVGCASSTSIADNTVAHSTCNQVEGCNITSIHHHIIFD
jgi:PBP1b-binding outer membrane lipoprotein LpoB